jgi:hypothetical protein
VFLLNKLLEAHPLRAPHARGKDDTDADAPPPATGRGHVILYSRPAHTPTMYPVVGQSVLYKRDDHTGMVCWPCKERSRRAYLPGTQGLKSNTRWTNSHSSKGQEKCWVVCESYEGEGGIPHMQQR